MSALMETIAELLVLAKQGDQRARGELLEQHSEFLLSLARRQTDSRIASRISASDVVQRTNLAALKSFDQFRDSQPEAFRAWLRTVHDRTVQNLGREHVRTQRRSVKREAPITGSGMARIKTPLESTPSQKMMMADAGLKLARAIETLPPDQHDAIRLRYIDGRSLEEIAAQMQRSKSSVAGLLKRGLQGLRQRMDPDDLP